MTLIKANPEAEVSQSFEAVKPGPYRMRIRAVKNRNPEKNDLEIELEHTIPVTELCGVGGDAIKGQPQRVFDYIMLAADKQWKLRALVESTGLPWGDVDDSEFQGKEVDVTLKIEEYNGEQRNKAGRYIVKKG